MKELSRDSAAASDKEEFIMMKHILSVFVENQTGVLVRVVSMFSRREFNIDSLSVGVTESLAFSRITVVMYGDENLVEQMIKQLEKMPVVRAVQRLAESGKDGVARPWDNNVHR